MATQSKTLWTGFDPVSGQTASITYLYDDALLRILSFTIANPTSKSIVLSAIGRSNNKTYSGTIPPNTAETTIAMTTGASNRLNITLTPSGKIDGVEYSINYG